MSVSIEPESPRHPDVLRLLEMSDAYMAALYPAESNHLLDVSALEQDGVYVFAARLGLNVVGCGALVASSDGTGELKRMFVDPAARGRSVGKLLLQRLEQQARDCGLSVIRLETGIHQPEALGLYCAMGFAERGPFGAYQIDPLSLFMEKRLS